MKTTIHCVWFCAAIALIAGANASLGYAQTDRRAAAGSALTYDGFTQPRHEILLAADEIGRVERVDVEVGQRVQQGQLIALLEDGSQAASLKVAKIQAEMTGELDAASAELQWNQHRAETLRGLAAEQAARPDELRRAETDLRIAKARLVGLQEQLKLRQAEYERAEIMWNRRKIRAPGAGVISEVFMEPGEYVSPSAPAIVELLIVDQLIAVFDVPVQEALRLKSGAPVRVRLMSTNESIESSIASITPKIAGESGTVTIRVALDNADGRLLSGDRCTLEFLSSQSRSSTVEKSSRKPYSEASRR